MSHEHDRSFQSDFIPPERESNGNSRRRRYMDIRHRNHSPEQPLRNIGNGGSRSVIGGTSSRREKAKWEIYKNIEDEFDREWAMERLRVCYYISVRLSALG